MIIQYSNSTDIIPYSKHDYLFISLNKIIEVVVVKSVLGRAYEENRNRNPGWPTYKSIMKYSSGDEDNLPTRLGSLSKIESLTLNIKEHLACSINQDDFYWDRYAEWSGFLQGFPFESELSRCYWLDKLSDSRELAFSLWKIKKEPLAKIKFYNDSCVVNKLGQSSSRVAISEVILAGKFSEVVGMALIADQFTVVLRMLAWAAVDRSLSLDATHVSQELNHSGLIAVLVPRLDESSAAWTDPVLVLFNQLATLCGCPKARATVPFLAEAWDAGDRDVKDNERLIRVWLNPASDVNPLSEILESFMQSLARHIEPYLWNNPSVLKDIFWLALAMRRIHHYLKSDVGVSDELLTAIYSSFKEEFQKAYNILYVE